MGPLRSCYTSLGHLNQTWQVRSSYGLDPQTRWTSNIDDLFLAHVVGGISWTSRSDTTRAFNSSGQVGNPGNLAADPEPMNGEWASILHHICQFLPYDVDKVVHERIRVRASRCLSSA
jgi:hypothetical protein